MFHVKHNQSKSVKVVDMEFEKCNFVDLVRGLLLCHDYYTVDSEFKMFVDILVCNALLEVEELVKKRQSPVFQFVRPDSDK